jgi:hypothetical protein
MSHMACLENIKFENLLSEILWLWCIWMRWEAFYVILYDKMI